MPDDLKNPEFVEYRGQQVKLMELLDDYRDMRHKLAQSKSENRSAVVRRRQEKSLKPYQAELIRMQRYLEETKTRMIIVFEGRDAAGKGGTIRRVSRYMNEKRYRLVALGKPTEEQRHQWFFQRYVAQFPTGGEVVLFDRSWYNRAVVEPIFGFCSEQEYQNFMYGVVGFEKDLVRQGTILVKLYFSVTKDEQARRFDERGRRGGVTRGHRHVVGPSPRMMAYMAPMALCTDSPKAVGDSGSRRTSWASSSRERPASP